jgi:hypothetical protein
MTMIRIKFILLFLLIQVLLIQNVTYVVITIIVLLASMSNTTVGTLLGDDVVGVIVVAKTNVLHL